MTIDKTKNRTQQERVYSELNGTGLFLESAVYKTLSKNPKYKVFREEPYIIKLNYQEIETK